MKKFLTLLVVVLLLLAVWLTPYFLEARDFRAGTLGELLAEDWQGDVVCQQLRLDDWRGNARGESQIDLGEDTAELTELFDDLCGLQLVRRFPQGAWPDYGDPVFFLLASRSSPRYPSAEVHLTFYQTNVVYLQIYYQGRSTELGVYQVQDLDLAMLAAYFG